MYVYDLFSESRKIVNHQIVALHLNHYENRSAGLEYNVNTWELML